MRRFLFTLVAGVAILALGPAGAMARGHHHRSHHRSHARHARIRVEHFGDQTTARTTPSTTPPTAETVGRISAFSPATTGMSGTLTILLNDGKTMVTGQVNGMTELKCETAQPDTTIQTDERGRSGDHGPGNGEQSTSGDDNGDNGNDQADDQGENENAQTCSMGSLAVGTKVREAELRISSAGAIWDKVELVG